MAIGDTLFPVSVRIVIESNRGKTRMGDTVEAVLDARSAYKKSDVPS